MYNFKRVILNTEDELLYFVQEEEIMMNYFHEDYRPKVLYKCPFKEEKVPSFYISYWKGRLKWRRFGLYDSPKSPVEFVMIKYSLTRKEAINKIYKDIVLENKTFDPIIIQEIRAISADEIDAAVEIRDLLDFEIEYFEAHHISEKTLKFYNVYGCSDSFINNIRFHKSKIGDPAFVYLHDKAGNSWSIYRPLAKPGKKHRKHNIRNHILGLNELPKSGDILVITKSMKDVMVFYELGIPAIAPHSERTFIPKNILDDLKSRFKRIVVVYDNDSTGVESSIKFTTENNLDYWNVPKDIDCKDPAEVSKKYGLEYLEEIFYEKKDK